MKIRLLVIAVVLAILGALGWGGIRMVKTLTATAGTEIPATRIKKGRVTIAVSARGELQGGNSEMLTAPMVGGGDIVITDLRDPGEVVEAGDVVVAFDTTMQEYNLREAEADLAEADQQVVRAEADSQAVDEESRWAVLAAQGEVRLAELEIKKNPLLPAIQRRQNEIVLEAAQNRLRQAEQDLKNKKTTSAAAINIQRAAQNKARVMAEMQRKNIENMTLHAKTGGYVNVSQNQNGLMIMYRGMSLPNFQVGDTARAGQTIAQIPDLQNWEVSANVGELDRGHLSPGQKVSVAVVALAGRSFPGHVKLLGGTSGPPWDRRFECRIALDQAGPELRPGMTSNLVITVDALDDVLWAPSQALFESDGRTFVYLRTPSGYQRHDVKLVRRSESQVILDGVKEGDAVALSSPDQQAKPTAPANKSGAMKALSK
jgi:HlyD family secretion protein